MAISKLILLLSFLIICAWARVCNSQGAGAGSMECLQKMMPCQQFVKDTSSPPPATCCVPLRQIVADDSQCLCAVFNNPEILKTFNVTQADGLNLAKACGAKADTSLCKTAAAPSVPAAPTTSDNSSTTHHKNAGAVLSHQVGGSLAVAVAIFSFIIFSSH